MKLKVDRESDALYLRLDESAIVESEEVQPGVVLDYDKDERLVGIEILSLSTRVVPDMIKRLRIRDGLDRLAIFPQLTRIGTFPVRVFAYRKAKFSNSILAE